MTGSRARGGAGGELASVGDDAQGRVRVWDFRVGFISDGLEEFQGGQWR
jgi:hypothetical protein